MLGRSVTHAPITLTGAATTSIVAAPGARLKIYVVTLVLVAGASGTYRFEEITTGDDLSGDIALAANGGLVVVAGDASEPVMHTNDANNGIQVVHSAGAAGWLRYYVAA